LRVLELQTGRRKCTREIGDRLVLTNQRDKAVEMLEQIIKEHPEKYQPYDLLAQVLDEEARRFSVANRIEEAKAKFRQGRC